MTITLTRNELDRVTKELVDARESFRKRLTNHETSRAEAGEEIERLRAQLEICQHGAPQLFAAIRRLQTASEMHARAATHRDRNAADTHQ